MGDFFAIEKNFYFLTIYNKKGTKMGRELKHTGNAVFSLNYHLIIVVKYRKRIFTNDKIITAFKDFTKTVGEPYGVKIKEQECAEDHVHFSYKHNEFGTVFVGYSMYSQWCGYITKINV